MSIWDRLRFKNRARPPTVGAFKRGAGRAVERGVTTFAIVMVVALGIVACAYSIGVTSGDWRAVLAVLGACLALETAAVSIGVLGGLLFGMPREADTKDDTRHVVRYLANTGLLRVSDWLTTVIVGLSLVSLRQIPGALRDFGAWMKPALGDSASSAGFAVSFALTGTGGAFILMFLWTTVTLRGHLEDQYREFTYRLLAEASVAKSDEDVDRFKQTLRAAPDESIADLGQRGWLDRQASLVRQAVKDEWARRFSHREADTSAEGTNDRSGSDEDGSGEERLPESPGDADSHPAPT